jgi:hypothetical protein
MHPRKHNLQIQQALWLGFYKWTAQNENVRLVGYLNVHSRVAYSLAVILQDTAQEHPELGPRVTTMLERF